MKRLIFLISIISILLASGINAYILYCLSDGESLPPDCDDNTDLNCRYTCDLSSGVGFCQICTTDSGIPTRPSRCHDVGSCSFLGDTGDLDQDPPILTLINPVEGETYERSRVYVYIEVDAPSRLEMKNNLNGGAWQTVSSEYVTYYNRKRTFDEGINDYNFRAIKRNGLTDEESIVFYVDSILPDFRDSWPDDGEFANGQFTVEYTEENLDRIELKYKGAKIFAT